MATVYQVLAPEEAVYLGSAFAQYDKVNGTNFPVTGIKYDAASTENAFWKLNAVNYGSGNLTLTLLWFADTATSGDVVWDTQIAAITPNTDSQDVTTDGLTTANTVTDSHLGTTGKRVHSIAVTISNLDSIAANDIFWVKITRDVGDAADTMAGDAWLVQAILTYSDT
jgi:hypothetical protein